MSRPQDDLPRWEGVAVEPSAGSEDETTTPTQPESPHAEEPTVVDVDADVESDVDADADVDADVGLAESTVDLDAGRARRRQALFGLLAACLTFGVALLLTGVIGDSGDGSDGDGSGDDVVTVDSTGPEPDLDEGSGSDEDVDRSGPVLSVDSDGSQAAAPTTAVTGGGESSPTDSSSGPAPTTTAAAGSSSPTASPGTAGVGAAPGRIVRDWNSDRNHEAIAAAADEPSWAVFEDFELVLRGEVPSDDVLDEVRTRIENVVGPASVVGDYDVVPGASAPTDPPLFVLSGVEFEGDGTTIAPASRTFLQLAFVLMLRYPQTEITVVHHSYPVRDSLIDEDIALAEGQAVVDFLTDLGVDPDRLSVESVAYNDRTASQGDIDDDRDGRWIDFVVRGLLEDS